MALEEKKEENGGFISQHKTGKGMNLVRLSVKKGELSSFVEIYQYGAHVTQWKESGKEKPFFFLSKDSVLDGSKAIRGGIPICFPQFSNFGSMKNHGFARISIWDIVDEKTDNDSAAVTFRLSPNEVTKKMWSGGSSFVTEYTVTLRGAENSTLSCSWRVSNTGDKPIEFTGALHTYFQVSDIGNVSVSDLSGIKYMDQLQEKKVFTSEVKSLEFDKETDSIYYSAPNTMTLTDKGGYVFTIEKKGLPDAVIWNPWIEKAKRMGDFDNDEYKVMVCVEAAAIENNVKVKAGKNWEAEIIISAKL